MKLNSYVFVFEFYSWRERIDWAWVLRYDLKYIPNILSHLSYDYFNANKNDAIIIDVLRTFEQYYWDFHWYKIFWMRCFWKNWTLTNDCQGCKGVRRASEIFRWMQTRLQIGIWYRSAKCTGYLKLHIWSIEWMSRNTKLGSTIFSKWAAAMHFLGFQYWWKLG